jgi:hypothetical protein
VRVGGRSDVFRDARGEGRSTLRNMRWETTLGYDAFLWRGLGCWGFGDIGLRPSVLIGTLRRLFVPFYDGSLRVLKASVYDKIENIPTGAPPHLSQRGPETMSPQRRQKAMLYGHQGWGELEKLNRGHVIT